MDTIHRKKLYPLKGKISKLLLIKYFIDLIKDI